jgi:glutaredoxin
MVKKRLDYENVEFEYILLESLPKEEEDEIRKKARLAGHRMLPLLVRNEEFITIQEV